MICNVLVSAVQSSESAYIYMYVCTYIHSFKDSFHHLGHCRVLSRVPCAMQ